MSKNKKGNKKSIIFIIISILFLVSLVLYFGFRLVYYYIQMH